MRRKQAQPYRKGGRPGAARKAMRRGTAYGRPHPSQEKRKMEKRAAKLRRALRKARRK